LYTVAVDLGGPFTVVVVIGDRNGRAYTGNTLSTPEDLQQRVRKMRRAD